MIPQWPSMQESMTAFAGYVFIILFVITAIVFFLYLKREQRQRQNVWNRFKKMAGEKGLKRHQHELLLRLAKTNRLNNPLSLFTALNTFDRYAGGYAVRLIERGGIENNKIIDEISKIRTVLGFDTLSENHPMRTTRQVGLGQHISLVQSDVEEDIQVACVVVSRDDRSIIVALMLQKDERYLDRWFKGDLFEARLSPEGHAEYLFATKIVEIMLDEKQIVLMHSEQVERTQIRDFVRWNTNFPLALYTISRSEFERIELGIELDEATRFECTATNISGGGLSVKTDRYLPPQSLVIVDPDFGGDFPIAGVVCETIGQLDEENTLHNIHMKFIDLPGAVEKGIVRIIFQMQIEESNPLS